MPHAVLGLWVALGLTMTAIAPAAATVSLLWDDPLARSGSDSGLINQGPPENANESENASGGGVRTLRLLGTSALVIGVAELVALPCGVMLAVLLTRTNLHFRRTFMGLLGVAALTPLPLLTSAWIGSFGNLGRLQMFGMSESPWLTGVWGAGLVHGLAVLPWATLITGAALHAVEPELEENAWLVMPAHRVLMTVSLRRCVGALLAAVIAAAVLTGGEMTVTDLLQVRTYAEESYIQFGVGQGAKAAAAAAIAPTLILGTGVFFLTRAYLTMEPQRLALARTTVRIWSWDHPRFPNRRTLVSLLVGFAIVAVMLAPVVGLVWRAGRVGGNAALGQLPYWSLAGLLGTLQRAGWEIVVPLRNSLVIAAAAALAAVGLAWPLAWWSRSSRLGLLVTLAVITVLFATPGPVLGMAFVLAYRGYPLIYDTPVIVIITQCARVLPYAVIILQPSLRAIPDDHIDSARLDGASYFQIFWSVAGPASQRASIAAMLVCFVLALGELPATHWVEPPGLPLLTKWVWGLMHTGVESHLAGVVLILLGGFGLTSLGVMLLTAKADPKPSA